MLIFLSLIFIQLSLVLSNQSNQYRCYSIQHCLKCPELDYCKQCEIGFKINKHKTKCKKKIKKVKKRKAQSKRYKPLMYRRANIPIQNFPSYENLENENNDDAIINRILVCILILFALALMASCLYHYYGKNINKGFSEDEFKEEPTNVVVIK